MHITILTIGSRGDVQPYVALGIGLKAAGHRVCLATEQDYQSFVTESGLEFARLPGCSRERHETEAWKHYLTHETDHIVSTISKGMVKFVVPTLRELLDESWCVCQGTDVIISMPQVPSSYLIAKTLGVPFISVWTIPNTPTSAFPHPYLKGVLPLGILNRLSYALVDLLCLQHLGPILNQWQAETLKRKPRPLSAIQEYYNQPIPTLYAYSPTVLPKPAEWGEHVHVNGFWNLDSQSDWQPASWLSDFLDDGPPPVYIGFGSSIWKDPMALTEKIVAAVKQSGQRAILDLGWGGIGDTDLPDTVLKIASKDAPHRWLLPQMAAAIHHGGSGTVGAVTRAGIPSMVIPSFYDHTFWGRRLADLGIGLPVLPAEAVSVPYLAHCIRTLAQDTTLKVRAASVGQQVRAEDGVGRSVEIIQRYLEAQTRPTAALALS